MRHKECQVGVRLNIILNYNYLNIYYNFLLHIIIIAFRYLSTIYSQKNVTSEYIEIALRSIALNPYGYHVAIQFIIQHWNEFNTNTTEGNNN